MISGSQAAFTSTRRLILGNFSRLIFFHKIACGQYSIGHIHMIDLDGQLDPLNSNQDWSPASK